MLRSSTSTSHRWQRKAWLVGLSCLLLLICVSLWALPILLETRLPPALRKTSQSVPQPQASGESGLQFVIVEYGNNSLESEDPETENSQTLAEADSPSGGHSSSAESFDSSEPEPSETLAPAPTPLPVVSERPSPLGEAIQAPLSSLPAQRQLVAPPSLPLQGDMAIPRPDSPQPNPASPSGLRLLVGPFQQRAQAQAAADKLTAAGHANQLLEDKGHFRVRLNQVLEEPDAALELADTVALLGYEIVVRKDD